MKISEMELLVRVAETGSMTLAAQQLHLTPAAVSAAVGRVESAIGVRIFERTTRSLRTTEEGELVIAGCADVVSRWRGTLDAARGSRTDLEGTIHVSAPADTTSVVLEDVVVDVCAEHPGLRVILDTSDSIKHLHGDAIDVAIRYGELQDSSLTARRLARLPSVFVASPDYVARRGAPTRPEQLVDHRCITLHLSNVPERTWRVVRDGEVREVPVSSPISGDGLLARRLALAGHGITRKSLFDVIDDLERGHLVRVLPEYTGREASIHMVFPSRQFLPARVRVLRDAVVEAFAAREARCTSWLTSS